MNEIDLFVLLNNLIRGLFFFDKIYISFCKEILLFFLIFFTKCSVPVRFISLKVGTIIANIISKNNKVRL